MTDKILFFTDTDKEDPNLVWKIYGLVDTNEILVVAQKGNTVLNWNSITEKRLDSPSLMSYTLL